MNLTMSAINSRIPKARSLRFQADEFCLPTAALQTIALTQTHSFLPQVDVATCILML